MDINLLGFITQNTSYGIATLEIFKRLVSQGRVSLFPIGGIHPEERFPPDLVIDLQKSINNSQLFDVNAPSIRICHQNMLAEHVGRQRINFPIFELTKFSDIEKNHLKSSDKILVASQWGKKVIEANGIDVPTYVVPLGTNRDIFNENVKAKLSNPRNTTRFINVGKWEKRKGHDFLAHAFDKAFRPVDNVELWMLPTNPFLNDDEVKQYSTPYTDSFMARAGKIKVLPRITHQIDVAELMASCDCMVLPSRAEGFCLPALDALSMGMELITTDYSAMTEYADSNNSSLIDIDKLEPANDGKWFHGQGEWASYGDNQISQLISHMRYVHSQKEQGKVGLGKNISGIATARDKFSWGNTVDKLLGAINV
jgi:glycosyltransferase involved in cell wall biosynthesis